MWKILRSAILPVILILATTCDMQSQAVGGADQATFIVTWYDVGKKVLDGREGIDTVNSGWLGTSEVNRVRFDPDKVTFEEMEDSLKEAGTYIRTVPIENM